MTQGRLRILLVDDEPDIVYVQKRGLELNGYEVHGFTDPLQALQDFAPGQYDAVITDIRMPGMTGLELYRAIRAKDPAVRVYFVSAFESYGEEIREKFVSDAELVRFVKKPTTYRVLAEMLTRDLERKHVPV
jgi:CheY-like chemotaxis protein